VQIGCAQIWKFHLHVQQSKIVQSGHNPVIRMLHCLFNVLKTHCSPCHPVMIQWSECSIVFLLFWKSHCSPCHQVTIQWSECSVVFLLFWKFQLFSMPSSHDPSGVKILKSRCPRQGVWFLNVIYSPILEFN
jgi:hypothetical protein